jgi:UDP-N-acetylmuramoyl-L-alanyl-D-glutamate--2,6-diaminopimelate ligase
MGEIASRFSDVVVITDDNPRTEDAAEIRRDVVSNAINEVQIAGREEAIKYAIEEMQKGDILLIAGKGHEDYQIIGKTKYPFDDALVARKYLAGKK